MCFHKQKQQITWQNTLRQHMHMTRAVHLHRYVMSTVLLLCPITSMTHPLSCQCSNRAGDKQSFLRILF